MLLLGPNFWKADCPVPHPLKLVSVDSFSSCDNRFQSMVLMRLVSFGCVLLRFVSSSFMGLTGKQGLLDLMLVSALVLAGFRCGSMGSAEFSADLKMEITKKVVDKIGNYFCLVPKGKYYVKIEQKNDDESYTEIFTSPEFEAENGIINRNFVI